MWYSKKWHSDDLPTLFRLRLSRFACSRQICNSQKISYRCVLITNGMSQQRTGQSSFARQTPRQLDTTDTKSPFSLMKPSAVDGNPSGSGTQPIVSKKNYEEALSLHYEDNIEQLADFRRAAQRMHERIAGLRREVALFRLHVSDTVNPLQLLSEDSRRTPKSTSPPAHSSSLSTSPPLHD